MTNSLAWIYLIASGLIDVAWAVTMKKANGFADPGWSAASLLLLAIFVYLLTKALAILPIGPAYAVWTGIGAAGSVIAGMKLFGEPVSIQKLACVAMIVAGIVGLKMTTE